MKLKFLGTSCGVPMPGRHYQSVMIDVGGELYLFDAGAPVMDCLINDGYNPEKLKAVFITHIHPDHMLGILDMLDLASLYYTDMSFEVYMPEQNGISAAVEFCKIMLSPFGGLSDKIKFVLYKQGRIYDDGKLAVTAFPTEHMKNGCSYGFVIEAEGNRICQTGDLSSTLKDFPSEALQQKTDVVISECAHFSAAALIEKLNQGCIDKAMVVHVSPETKYEELKSLEKIVSFKLILPNDGDEYVL